MSSFHSDYTALKSRFGRFVKTWHIVRRETPSGVEDLSLSIANVTGDADIRVYRVLKCPMYTRDYDITPSIIMLQKAIRARLNRVK